MSRFENLEFGGQQQKRTENRPALKDEGYYLNEGHAHFSEGEFEKALRSYAKVLEYNPGNVGAWTGQVRMLIELGEYNEARVWVDRALELFPHAPELLAAKAVALGRSGDHKGALVFSDAAVEERGDTPYVWLARADVLLGRNEKTAEYSFQKAFTLAGADWLVHWLASRIQYFHRQFAAALRSAQQALNLESSRAMAWLQTGLCQMALGITAQAENSFQQARQLNPACQEAILRLNEIGHLGPFSRLRNAWRQLFVR